MVKLGQDTTAALKLLVITGTWPPMRCGVGDYTAQLCDHLSRLAMNVHVLTSRPARAELRMDGANLLEVHPLIEHWNFRALGIIKNAVAEIKPDIIDLQWPTAAYGHSLAVNLLPFFLRTTIAPKTALVTTLHELRYFNLWTQLRVLPALAFSQRLILVDPLDLEAVRRLLPPAAVRCRQIPIGSNLPVVGKSYNRAECRRRLGFTDENFVVGFFGFANAPKGMETLFAALRLLKDALPGLRLLLLSQLSDASGYQARLKHDLKATGLSAITVNPEYAEPRLAAEMLAGADCAVLPFVDGVSVKRGSLMACLAQGLPIVTTTPVRGEINEFQHKVNMLLVPPRDAKSLAEAVRTLVEDPDLRARLALGAWDLARRFSWDDIAQRQLAVFEEVLGDAP
jgi:glycosyltransferase involved in cell wall biosynthesis